MDYKDLAKKLNTFCQNNPNEVFTSEQLYAKLEEIGFNKSIAKRVAALFDFEKDKTAKIYTPPKKPIHQDKIASLYKAQTKYNTASKMKRQAEKEMERANSMTEKKALELLQSKGYRIKKIVGFDMDKFMAEQPAMYRRYAIYEYL